MRSLFIICGSLLLLHGACAQITSMARPMNALVALDPAVAGAHGAIGGALLHRSRDANGGARFSSSVLVMDMALGATKRAKADLRSGFGTGLLVSDERAGSPRTRTSTLASMIAYHVRVGAFAKVGGGVQLGVQQRWSDLGDAAWGSQYNGLAYDPDRPSGEHFANAPRTVGDLGAGVHFQYGREGSAREGRRQMHMRAGVAVQHLARPRLSSDPDGERMARKWSAFALGAVGLGQHNTLEPFVQAAVEGGVPELQGGAMWYRTLAGKRSFAGPDHEWVCGLGSYARLSGNIIASASCRFAGFGAALSYELAVGRWSAAMGSRGTSELVLFYEPAAGTRR